MSPPVPYIEHVYLPTLFEMGVRATLTHRVWGFYPQGGGEIAVEIAGNATLAPLLRIERGAPQAVGGLAFVSRLPSHIPQRMSDRARSLLRTAEFPRVHVEPAHVKAPGTGAGIALWVRYARGCAGSSALGRKGLPSEAVAEMACEPLLHHHRANAAADPHLGDQLVLPFVLAGGTSRATISKVTPHLLTNAWVARQFELAEVRVTGAPGEPGTLEVVGTDFVRSQSL
jgi:RNA 3'-terminal phosphate cyclase (ATP)